MHPLFSAWISYSTRMDQQPDMRSSDWSPWLDDMVELESWWATLRRLPRGMM
jgi:hypothetical protein